MKIFVIDEKMIGWLIEYLKKRPFEEVADAIRVFSSLKTVEQYHESGDNAFTKVKATESQR